MKRKVLVVRNKETKKWRILDLELKVYSDQEWNSREEAFKIMDKYTSEHSLR